MLLSQLNNNPTTTLTDLLQLVGGARSGNVPFSPLAPGLAAPPPAAAPALPQLPTMQSQPQQGAPDLSSLLAGFGGQQGQASSAVADTMKSVVPDVQAGVKKDVNASLMEAMQAPETSSGFMAMFKSPEFKELLLQTGLRMSQGQNFGESLAGGALAARDVKEKGMAGEANAAKAAQESKLAEAENSRRDRETAVKEANVKIDAALADGTIKKNLAEIGKIDADTQMALAALADNSPKGKISEADYSRIHSDMYETVLNNALFETEDTKSFLDPETKTTYLLNKTLPKTSRRYGPLKATYVTEISALMDKVINNTATMAELSSRRDEYDMAFGEDAVDQMMLQLEESRR